MGLVKFSYDFIKDKKNLANIFFKKETFEDISEELLIFLNELKELESSFWGVNIIHIKNNEEKIIEDSNHLIYIISRNDNENLVKILQKKDVKDFFVDLNNLFEDFKTLKRKIHQRDKLKNLITKLSIKLVDKNHYKDLENIFILEKQLYNVLDRQDLEFKNALYQTSKLKINIDNNSKVDKFIEILKNIRNILGGNLEFHNLWEEERAGYSNSSNIIYSLIKSVNNLMEKNKK